MNLANKLTLLRIFLVPVFLVFIVPKGIPFGKTIATVIFILAAITDKLDGYIARSRNQITRFGKIMDPLADKLLVSAALITLVEFHVIPAYVAIIIIAREFAVTGLRSVAAAEGMVIAANWWGKIKTVCQIVAVIFALLYINIRKNVMFASIVNNLNIFGIHNKDIVKFFHYGTNVTMFIAVVATIVSGIEIFVKNKEVFMNDK